MLVTGNYCQNDFKMFNTREVRCLTFCWSIKRKLKTYTLEEFKKLPNVYQIKREKKEFIIDKPVRKVDEKFIL